MHKLFIQVAMTLTVCVLAPAAALQTAPALRYAGYMPGRVKSLAVDAAGYIYLAGDVGSNDRVSATPGAFQPQPRGAGDGFLTKLTPDGKTVVYTTFLGGSAQDAVNSITVDAAGNAYLIGSTLSNDFPLRNALQSAPVRRTPDTFIAWAAKLDATGSQLLYATYFSGENGFANLTDLTLAGTTMYAAGNAADAAGTGRGCVLGVDMSKSGAASRAYYFFSPEGFGNFAALAADATGKLYLGGSAANTGPDVLLAKLDPARSGEAAVLYRKLLGGGADDRATSVKVDGAGAVYLTGATSSTDFPTTANAFRRTSNQACANTSDLNCYDTFLLKLNGENGEPLYASYLGGGKFDRGDSVMVAANDLVYVAGVTASPDFPVTNDALQASFQGDANRFGSGDVFLTKLNTGRSGAAGLIYSTYFGGRDNELTGLLAKGDGAVHLSGVTASANIPLTPDALNPVLDAPGGLASLLVKFSDAAVLKPPSPARPLANVSAASYGNAVFAPESIVAAFGSALATSTQVAVTTPLPATFAGTTVRVRDAAGVERSAPLFFVSPTQINYLLPAGTANGQATVTVTSGDGTLSAATVQVAAVAPGLFTAEASGRGLAAAVVLRVKADGTQSYEAIAQFDFNQNRFVAAPIDLGAASEQVFLILYGTGWRGRSGLNAVSVSAGGVDAPVSFAGAVTGLAGLDQINARLPRSLIGRGDVSVTLTADGQTANAVSVRIK